MMLKKILNMRHVASFKPAKDCLNRLPDLCQAVRPRLVAGIIAALIISYVAVDIGFKITRANPRIREAAAITRQSTESRPGKAALGSYAGIMEKNLFGSSDNPIAGAGTATALQAASVQVELMGTVAGNGPYSYAIIEDPSQKKQRLVKVGDKIADARVTEIMRGAIVLQTGERKEILKMKTRAEGPVAALQPAPAAAATGPGGTTALKEAGELLSTGQMRPHFTEGRMDGMMVGKVREGGALQRAGMEDGDIVQGVNGSPITSPQDAMNIQRQILENPNSRISLQLLRRGNRVTINLN